MVLCAAGSCRVLCRLTQVRGKAVSAGCACIHRTSVVLASNPATGAQHAPVQHQCEKPEVMCCSCCVCVCVLQNGVVTQPYSTAGSALTKSGWTAVHSATLGGVSAATPELGIWHCRRLGDVACKQRVNSLGVKHRYLLLFTSVCCHAMLCCCRRNVRRLTARLKPRTT